MIPCLEKYVENEKIAKDEKVKQVTRTRKRGDESLGNRRESWLAKLSIKIKPAIKNKGALKRAWETRWNIIMSELPRPVTIIISPKFARVDIAIIFLMS